MRQLLKELKDIKVNLIRSRSEQLKKKTENNDVIDRKNIIAKEHRIIPDYENVESFIYLPSLVKNRAQFEDVIKNQICSTDTKRNE